MVFPLFLYQISTSSCRMTSLEVKVRSRQLKYFGLQINLAETLFNKHRLRSSMMRSSMRPLLSVWHPPQSVMWALMSPVIISGVYSFRMSVNVNKVIRKMTNWLEVNTTNRHSQSSDHYSASYVFKHIQATRRMRWLIKDIIRKTKLITRTIFSHRQKGETDTELWIDGSLDVLNV